MVGWLCPGSRFAFQRQVRQTHITHRTQGIIFADVQCIGHILNLSISVFWFGDLGGTGSQEQLDVIIVTDETMALWRKLGP